MARLVKILMAGIRTGDLPVSSGLVYTYATGTTTPATHLYSDNTLLSAHSNPATLDAEGRLEAYCSDTANFRIVVKNAAGTVTIIDVDPAESSNSTTLANITVGSALANAFTDGSGETASDAVGFLWSSLNGQSSASTAKDLKYLHTGTGATGRTIRARFSDVFNVMDFGAAGTGSADDTAAIQAAIDAAATAGGGGVYIPGNIYRCDSSLTIANKDMVSIFGDGPGSIIRQNFSNAALITISGTSDSIEIASLQLQGGGSALTTDALGISVASGIPASMTVPVNIHNVVFSGPSDGTGFNVGVEALGSRGSVSNCYFQRIYGANSRAVRTNGTGCTSWRIENNHILGVDGAGTRMVTGIGSSATGGGDRTIVVGNYIEGTSGAGIWFTGNEGVVVQGNYLYLCAGAGVRLTSTLWSSVTGNTMDGCQHGVLVDEDGATSGTPPAGWTITGNSIAASTLNGVRIINATDSNDYTPRVGNVSGNTIRTSTRSAIYMEGCDSVLVQGNMMAFCSTDATYPAIDVLTSKPSATHRGGECNSIIGNHVMDTTGATWLTCVRIQASGGSAVTNVSSTFVFGNHFKLPLGGSAWFLYGVATSSPRIFGNHTVNVAGLGYGEQKATYHMSSSTTVPAGYSGGVITNAGAAGAVTATLPTLAGTTASEMLSYTFIRYANANFSIAAGGTDTLVRRDNSTGTVVLSGTTDQIVHVYSRNTFWYCDVVDYTT